MPGAVDREKADGDAIAGGFSDPPRHRHAGPASRNRYDVGQGWWIVVPLLFPSTSLLTPAPRSTRPRLSRPRARAPHLALRPSSPPLCPPLHSISVLCRPPLLQVHSSLLACRATQHSSHTRPHHTSDPRAVRHLSPFHPSVSSVSVRPPVDSDVRFSPSVSSVSVGQQVDSPSVVSDALRPSHPFHQSGSRLDLVIRNLIGQPMDLVNQKRLLVAKVLVCLLA